MARPMIEGGAGGKWERSLLGLLDRWLRLTSLQRTNTENLTQIFPEKELRGHRLNFHIHVSVSDFNIPRSISLFYCRNYVERSWEYINRSQTHECENGD